ncbi:hypothetical protein [Microbulbifer elongatus]|uniref:hypothetical protein n=1 Tax=Microbulbifer elongatus TaxID=86173 RepID=UPI001CFF48A3|nr:hypothetical protein [Microbulbifer elongatus]
MSKLGSVTENFGQHLASGICDLTRSLYPACKKKEFHSKIEIDLLHLRLPLSLAGFPSVALALVDARDKFESILESQTKLHINDVLSLDIVIDFMFGSELVEKRKREMGWASVYYDVDPLFQAQVHLVMKNGFEGSFRSQGLGQTNEI